MLFALPAVRDTLPGTPTIGCTSDLVGFFWNMGLIATSAILLLWRFSFQDIPKDKELQKPLIPAESNSSIQKTAGPSIVPVQKTVDLALVNVQKTVDFDRNSIQSVGLGRTSLQSMDLGLRFVNEDEIEMQKLVQ
jgi:Domain of unknown function (DUF4436)